MKKKCGYCSKDFDVPNKELNRGNGKYCSRSCSAKAGNQVKKNSFYSNLKKINVYSLKIDHSIGNYISGLIDGEGSFMISLSKIPATRIKAVFKVELSIDDREILEWVKTIFNCGNTYWLPQRNYRCKQAYRYVVQDLENLITKVIPFFEQFPLQGRKAQDFIRFKTILHDFINNEILDTPLYSKLADKVKKLNKEYLQAKGMGTELLNGNYISGLTDGEGSFAIKITKDKEMRSGYRVKPVFSIQLCDGDIWLLRKVRNTLNCGTVRLDRKRNIADFSVQSITALQDVVIPFF